MPPFKLNLKNHLEKQQLYHTRCFQEGLGGYAPQRKITKPVEDPPNNYIINYVTPVGSIKARGACPPIMSRPVLPEMLNLFSKTLNFQWKEMGAANTTFALYLGVDFKLEKLELTLDDMIQQQMNDGHLTQEDLNVLMKTHNNIVQTQTMVLRVIKK